MPANDDADVFTRLFLGLLLLAGIVYVAVGLTPSSYGVMLAELGAPEAGPVFGQARPVRSDEWAVVTPFFQAAVRNHFHEVNEGSFYREGLRNLFPTPLKNWSLVFRPQLWAFFLTGPATAYSIYFACLICATLAGYTLLFRELGANGLLAAAASMLVFFSGFTQFWGMWSLAGVPWLLLVVLKPLGCFRNAWWRKALVFAWLMPATALALPYPPMFIDLGFAALLLLAAVRRDWFRSPREYGAVAAGTLVTGLVLYGYFRKLIPVLGNTVYPGHRISPPGTVPIPVVLSQVFPFLTISLSDFANLTGLNAVEIGTIGSFLPILTLCLLRFRDFWRNRPVRIAVLTLLFAAAVMTAWQVAPVPRWIGRLLLWDIADPERLFCATGLLLTIACVLVWSNKLVAVHPMRILCFLWLGPVGSWILKAMLFPQAFEVAHDLAICGFAVVGCAMALYLKPAARGAVLLTVVAAINFFEFGRFNPLQPAKPIFETPQTAVLTQLREEEAATPGHILLEQRFTGATLNGIGFRSVSHVLPAPELAIFRKYFPAMDSWRFNQVFNRYGHIVLSEDRVPNNPQNDVIRVPVEVFQPIRNLRHVSFTTELQAGKRQEVCADRFAGRIESASTQSGVFVVQGWAPWRGEDSTQGLRVLSSQALRSEALATVARPDIAEGKQDYGYVKSGFAVRMASLDGQPVRPKEIVILATGTAQGEIRLNGPECP